MTIGRRKARFLIDVKRVCLKRSIKKQRHFEYMLLQVCNLYVIPSKTVYVRGYIGYRASSMSCKVTDGFRGRIADRSVRDGEFPLSDNKQVTTYIQFKQIGKRELPVNPTKVTKPILLILLVFRRICTERTSSFKIIENVYIDSDLNDSVSDLHTN